MSETNDGEVAEGTQEPTGSNDNSTPEGNDSPQVDPIALARKRQAGAEAARQKAEEARDAALKELEIFRAKERTVEDQSLADNAKLQERLAAAELAVQEAENRATARILDALYPNARAKLPEVTDEVRLAEFEALLSDGPSDPEPPAPQNPNESNRTASAVPAGTKPKEETSEDILARMKAMGLPDWLT